MSNEKHETIDDIVKEMRENAKHNHAIVEVYKYLTEIADRIEAANKREREATRDKSSVVGNAAVMREALEQIRGLLSIGGKPDTSMCIRYEAAYQIAEEALTAPPRNCDRFATLDDARNAFFADYMPDETCSSATAFSIWIFDKVKGEAK